MRIRNWVIGIGGFLLLSFCFLFFMSGLGMMLMGSEWLPQKGDIAIVLVEGEIIDPLPFIRKLESLSERDDVSGVIIRVDSPGGLVSASQEMYRAVRRLSETKKVVTSMGTVAASGGYYIACGSEKIVANEGTITGSIGVKINHVNVEQLVSLLRVEPRVMTSGPFKDMGSPMRPLQPDEERLFQDMINQMHSQFKSVVAQARGLSAERVDEIADGRVYTGEEAKAVGLVDKIGSIQDAIDLVATMAGIEGKPKVIYPLNLEEHWVRFFVKAVLSESVQFLQGVQQSPRVMWRL